MNNTISENQNNKVSILNISIGENKVPILSVNYILVPKDGSMNNVDVNDIINENNIDGFKNIAIKAAEDATINEKISISKFLEKFYLLPYEINISGGKLTNPTKIPADTEVVIIDGDKMTFDANKLKSVPFHGGNSQRQLEGGYYSNHSNKPKVRKFANTKHTKKNHKRSYYKK